MRKYRNITKATTLVLESLVRLRHEKFKQLKGKVDMFVEKRQTASKGVNGFNLAVNKRWMHSADKVRCRIGRDLNDFSYFLQEFKEQVNRDVAKTPSFKEVFEAIRHLEQEFDPVNIDIRHGVISVITEDITLEGICFGRFEIKLFVQQIYKLNTDSPYRIVALEPYPAGSNSEVTHPHVSDERLCEGDGFMPIRKSLEQGRICDFFTIIDQILKTYNPESPYVSLSEWEGTNCYDCGYTVSGDDVYFCEDCQRDYCSSCSTYCQICDVTVCLGCSYECPVCMKPVCRDCVATCSDCEGVYCKDCIDDEGLCEHCQEQRKEQEDEEETTTSPEPAVQSDGMGETRISA